MFSAAKMKNAYILVGVPGSGKSTWVDAQRWIDDNVVVTSTDKYVEAFAKREGKTYSEVFEEYMPEAVGLMVNEVLDAIEEGKDIVWDQTSTTVPSRAKKIRMLDGYKKIVVVFKIPSENELHRRLMSRPGKTIPEDVVKRMIEQYEEPTLEEGFDELWRAE